MSNIITNIIYILRNKEKSMLLVAFLITFAFLIIPLESTYW